ncbi:hypothetical protein LX32DRAFT_351901 [Colletotrichum zoysiae]|uniref:Uncharacterized protein n=1 Tax=Colletotrichum zoysiae TaxID=1216348 RepID=A0AAD9HIK8_9PEZI|nr:hypothetical protein LX32DRAFT_351901 [Colletotrichum zoysiae]
MKMFSQHVTKISGTPKNDWLPAPSEPLPVPNGANPHILTTSTFLCCARLARAYAAPKTRRVLNGVQCLQCPPVANRSTPSCRLTPGIPHVLVVSRCPAPGNVNSSAMAPKDCYLARVNSYHLVHQLLRRYTACYAFVTLYSSGFEPLEKNTEHSLRLPGCQHIQLGTHPPRWTPSNRHLDGKCLPPPRLHVGWKRHFHGQLGSWLAQDLA